MAINKVNGHGLGDQIQFPAAPGVCLPHDTSSESGSHPVTVGTMGFSSEVKRSELYSGSYPHILLSILWHKCLKHKNSIIRTH